ncbi:Uncharacterized protein OBRU01_06078 [Operophtera brumata]|uniref:Uncharacterized protein n=1 Tax=Operophtera brumata TaxID=104452 RepID=A0A0L7LM24_OPEBR|nr:Uncharacterized protein OBRU01_06078 [Operophtera brumata]
MPQGSTYELMSRLVDIPLRSRQPPQAVQEQPRDASDYLGEPH